jgi:uncharacterized membrane protein YjdF
MRTRTRVLGGITLAYLIVFGTIAVLRWNYEFIFYGAVFFLQIGWVVWLDRRVNFSTGVLLALAGWGLLHMAGGTVPIPDSVTEPGSIHTLYNLRVHPDLPKYDQMVHAYGFAVATWAAGEALRRRLVADRIAWFTVLVLIGIGLGALNEVIEFAATRIMPGTNVGGYVNTGWDLVSNLTGASISALLFTRRRATLPPPASREAATPSRT